jgi:hypothetical protein
MLNKKRNFYLQNPLINNNGTITPRPCTNTDLCMVYGVHRRTIEAWLKPFSAQIGDRVSYYYTQKQVEFIFEKLGEPKDFDFEKHS